MKPCTKYYIDHKDDDNTEIAVFSTSNHYATYKPSELLLSVEIFY